MHDVPAKVGGTLGYRLAIRSFYVSGPPIESAETTTDPGGPPIESAEVTAGAVSGPPIESAGVTTGEVSGPPIESAGAIMRDVGGPPTESAAVNVPPKWPAKMLRTRASN